MKPPPSVRTMIIFGATLLLGLLLNLRVATKVHKESHLYGTKSSIYDQKGSVFQENMLGAPCVYIRSGASFSCGKPVEGMDLDT